MRGTVLVFAAAVQLRADPALAPALTQAQAEIEQLRLAVDRNAREILLLQERDHTTSVAAATSGDTPAQGGLAAYLKDIKDIKVPAMDLEELATARGLEYSAPNQWQSRKNKVSLREQAKTTEALEEDEGKKNMALNSLDDGIAGLSKRIGVTQAAVDTLKAALVNLGTSTTGSAAGSGSTTASDDGSSFAEHADRADRADRAREAAGASTAGGMPSAASSASPNITSLPDAPMTANAMLKGLVAKMKREFERAGKAVTGNTALEANNSAKLAENKDRIAELDKSVLALKDSSDKQNAELKRVARDIEAADKMATTNQKTVKKLKEKFASAR